MKKHFDEQNQDVVSWKQHPSPQRMTLETSPEPGGAGHAHTHTLAFSNAWQVLQAKPDLGPDLLLEGSRKQCHDPGVRPEVKV